MTGYRYRFLSKFTEYMEFCKTCAKAGMDVIWVHNDSDLTHYLVVFCPYKWQKFHTISIDYAGPVMFHHYAIDGKCPAIGYNGNMQLSVENVKKVAKELGSSIPESQRWTPYTYKQEHSFLEKMIADGHADIFMSSDLTY